MNKKSFLNADDNASFMDMSASIICKVIKKLKKELTQPGYIAVFGTTGHLRFERKVYGLS